MPKQSLSRHAVNHAGDDRQFASLMASARASTRKWCGSLVIGQHLRRSGRFRHPSVNLSACANAGSHPCAGQKPSFRLSRQERRADVARPMWSKALAMDLLASSFVGDQGGRLSMRAVGVRARTAVGALTRSRPRRSVSQVAGRRRHAAVHAEGRSAEPRRLAAIERAGLWAAVVSTVISAVALTYTGLAYRDQLETNAQQQRAIAQQERTIELQAAALNSQRQSMQLELDAAKVQRATLAVQLRIAQEQLAASRRRNADSPAREQG